MVLVILIALWAIVLVPPYLKDRRASTGTFRAGQDGALPAVSSAQRFLPLQQAGPVIHSSVPAAMVGPAVSPVPQSSQPVLPTVGVDPIGPAHLGQGDSVRDQLGSNVVALHPRGREEVEVFGQPLADEQVLHQAWDPGHQSRAGIPSSTAAARERRRHVLMVLTGAAFVTLMVAMSAGGAWVALNVAIDASLVGYVILLVRFRQISAERARKVEPIRPPVTEQPPMTIQLAPSYLVQSGS